MFLWNWPTEARGQNRLCTEQIAEASEFSHGSLDQNFVKCKWDKFQMRERSKKDSLYSSIHLCYPIPNKSSLRKKEFILACSSGGRTSSWWEDTVAGMWNSWSHTKVRKYICSAHFSLIDPNIPDNCHPTVRAGLSCYRKYFWKHQHKPTEMCVSQWF